MGSEGEQHALYYSDDLIANLQLRWGEGFMSPGGSEELTRMMQGIDVSGSSGIDLGCGISGYDRLLVERHGAAKVVGIDLGGASIEQAKALARRNGLENRLEFRKVDAAGPLPSRTPRSISFSPRIRSSIFPRSSPSFASCSG